MTLAAIALGANLGDAAASVRDAMQALASLPDTRWLAGSPLYRTAPVGYADQRALRTAAKRVLGRTDLS